MYEQSRKIVCVHSGAISVIAGGLAASHERLRADLQGATEINAEMTRLAAKALESLDSCDYMSACDRLRSLLIVKMKEEPK